MASPEPTGGREPPSDSVERGPRWRFVDTLLLAAALGFAFGLGEAAALGWRSGVRDMLTHVTPHVTWMAPVGYAGLFILLTPLVRLVSALRFGRGPAFAVSLFTTLGFVGWLEMTPWTIHPLALWGLAGAIAVRLGMLAADRGSQLRRFGRFAAPGLAIPVAIAALMVAGPDGRSGAPADDDAFSTRGASARVGVAGTAGPRLNVLLLILDTVRAKSLGLYGGKPEITPRIDALSGESIVFDRAISTAPWTLPSHASMFTGRWPHELSVGWSAPLDDAEPTLAEALGAIGYATAGFVGNLAYGSRQYGLARGFDHYEDFPVTVGQVVLATSLGRTVATADWLRARLGNHELLNRKTAAHLRRALLEWVDRRAERPFFVFMNFYDAHEPFEPPQPFRERFAGGFRHSNVQHRHNLLRGVNARRIDKWAMSEADVAGELAMYEASIASIDFEIGAILDGLEERGLLDSTLVILTADHGEQMGEHGLFDHMQSLYQPLTHVPLLIRLPGLRRLAASVGTPVSLVDLSATVLDLVGAEGGSWPGHSLRGTWSPETVEATVISPAVSQLARGLVEQPWYPIASGLEMQAVVYGSHHYICNPDGTEELYDLSRDPDESVNLVGLEAASVTIQTLRDAVAPVGAPPEWCPPPGTETPRPPDRRH